ncbi:MAG: hypothetical protein QXP53_00660 [Candidatus Pacearchaeota archaeon]
MISTEKKLRVDMGIKKLYERYRTPLLSPEDGNFYIRLEEKGKEILVPGIVLPSKKVKLKQYQDVADALLDLLKEANTTSTCKKRVFFLAMNHYAKHAPFSLVLSLFYLNENDYGVFDEDPKNVKNLESKILINEMLPYSWCTAAWCKEELNDLSELEDAVFKFYEVGKIKKSLEEASITPKWIEEYLKKYEPKEKVVLPPVIEFWQKAQEYWFFGKKVEIGHVTENGEFNIKDVRDWNSIKKELEDYIIAIGRDLKFEFEKIIEQVTKAYPGKLEKNEEKKVIRILRMVARPEELWGKIKHPSLRDFFKWFEEELKKFKGPSINIYFDERLQIF